jgi:hypothetical protein
MQPKKFDKTEPTNQAYDWPSIRLPGQLLLMRPKLFVKNRTMPAHFRMESALRYSYFAFSAKSTVLPLLGTHIFMFSDHVVLSNFHVHTYHFTLDFLTYFLKAIELH